MKSTTLLFAFSLVLLFSCQEKDVPTPDCIEKSITEFKAEVPCNNGAYVKQYEFEGDLIYGFWDGDCGSDFAESIYNKNCELICSLGGFSGNQECDDFDFEDYKNNVTVLWSN